MTFRERLYELGEDILTSGGIGILTGILQPDILPPSGYDPLDMGASSLGIAAVGPLLGHAPTYRVAVWFLCSGGGQFLGDGIKNILNTL